MITYKNGDVLTSDTNMIVHQVNCQGVMGVGLAKQIKERYPVVYDKYIRFVEDFSNKEDLLGMCQFVPVDNKNNKIIANVFGQLHCGRGNTVYTNYHALETGLTEVFNFAKQFNLSVAIPYNIGCGLANGDWNTVEYIIKTVFHDGVECEIWKL